MWWLLAAWSIDWKWLGGILLSLLLILALTVGSHVQPWAPWWYSGGASVVALGGGAEAVAPLGNLQIGGVSDTQRYGLARVAGFNAGDAIIATAISIAENGTGDPAVLSAANRDGSRDLGLWQINSGWWPQFGGRDALTVPINNARAAFAIYLRQGWCAWSVYLASCGPGHTGAYAANMGRAHVAASAY